jgi:hypothetical protein
MIEEAEEKSVVNEIMKATMAETDSQARSASELRTAKEKVEISGRIGEAEIEEAVARQEKIASKRSRTETTRKSLKSKSLFFSTPKRH